MKFMTLEEALKYINQLSVVDKVRLIERIAPEIERKLMVIKSTPRKSLWSLCADLGKAPSAENIDQARREEWADFPRDYF
jgi:hypothetical protein